MAQVFIITMGNPFKILQPGMDLINNSVIPIYEDKTGNIWFGTEGGASRYDGKSFRNFIISEDSIIEDRTGKTFRI